MLYSFLTLSLIATLVNAEYCSFHLSVSGGISGYIGQLEDGQNRVGGGYTPSTFQISNGGIIDSKGSGCILTPGVRQFQCDQGVGPTYGFSIEENGVIYYNHSPEFYACPASDVEWNVYTIPVAGQLKCVRVTLTADNCHAPSYASPSKPAATGSTPPYPHTTSPVYGNPLPPVSCDSDVVAICVPYGRYGSCTCNPAPTTANPYYSPPQYSAPEYAPPQYAPPQYTPSSYAYLSPRSTRSDNLAAAQTKPALGKRFIRDFELVEYEDRDDENGGRGVIQPVSKSSSKSISEIPSLPTPTTRTINTVLEVSTSLSVSTIFSVPTVISIPTVVSISIQLQPSVTDVAATFAVETNSILPRTVDENSAENSAISSMDNFGTESFLILPMRNRFRITRTVSMQPVETISKAPASSSEPVSNFVPTIPVILSIPAITSLSAVISLPRLTISAPRSSATSNLGSLTDIVHSSVIDSSSSTPVPTSVNDSISSSTSAITSALESLSSLTSAITSALESLSSSIPASTSVLESLSSSAPAITSALESLSTILPTTNLGSLTKIVPTTDLNSLTKTVPTSVINSLSSLTLVPTSSLESLLTSTLLPTSSPNSLPKLQPTSVIGSLSSLTSMPTSILGSSGHSIISSVTQLPSSLKPFSASMDSVVSEIETPTPVLISAFSVTTTLLVPTDISVAANFLIPTKIAIPARLFLSNILLSSTDPPFPTPYLSLDDSTLVTSSALIESPVPTETSDTTESQTTTNSLPFDLSVPTYLSVLRPFQYEATQTSFTTVILSATSVTEIAQVNTVDKKKRSKRWFS